jgi:hypothetical protein
MLEAARLSRWAIERIDNPALIPREISSRSLKLKTLAERRRARGAMPPV